MKLLNSIAKKYSVSAIMVLNTLLVLLVLNLVLVAVFKIRDRVIEVPDDSRQYEMDSLRVVYPGLDEAQINDLLEETWTIPYRYEPFTTFKEPDRAGTYVNVDPNGFRITANQGPWPPDEESYNVFMFGGSTTFGYGVSDEETIASHLQKALADATDRQVSVYNFGRGFYYSSQERILFEKLAVAGFTPDMAIFVDGINDFFNDEDQPEFTDQLEQFFEVRSEGVAAALGKLIGELPMSRAVESLTYRFASARACEDAINSSGEGSDVVNGLGGDTTAGVIER